MKTRRRHRAHAAWRAGPPPRSSRSAAPPCARASPPTSSTPSCHQAYIDRGGYPSPLNYRGFPKSLCTSVNEVICHGIPDDRALRRRRHRQPRRHDLPRRRPRRHQRHLPRRRRRRRLAAVWSRSPASASIGASPPCARAGRSTTSAGPSRSTPRPTASAWCAAFVGHGIGEQFHTDLQIPHYYEPRLTTVIEDGHDLHHRADDHHRHRGRTASGTTTGPRSPPTAAAPPSSSTPCSSPTTASRC